MFNDALLNQSEVASVAPFITTWKTDNSGNSNNDQVQLFFPGIYVGSLDFLIEWGDGNEDTRTTNNPITHTYASAGTYTITITPAGPQTFSGFRHSSPFEDQDKFISVEQWGGMQPEELAYLFAYCDNVVINATDEPDLSVCNTIENLCFEASNFNSSLNGWDVSNIDNFLNVFRGAAAFNQPLDNWDMSSATRIDNMFYGAAAFNQDIGGWDVSNVDDFENTFRGATVFNQDLSGWDTSSATDMGRMFQLAVAFDQDIGGWDITGVTDVNWMFLNAGLSTTNYDALLIGWEAQSVVSGRTFNAGSSQYTTGGAAETARDDLIAGPNSWTINDGGPA